MNQAAITARTLIGVVGYVVYNIGSCSLHGSNDRSFGTVNEAVMIADVCAW